MSAARWIWIALSICLLITALAASFSVLGSEATRQSTTSERGTPCPPPSPVAATALASPSPDFDANAEVCPSTAPESMEGTPIAISGMTINLTADSNRVGPVTLTVDFQEQAGTPVPAASVTVTARSLEMDMGATPHDADETNPGRYVAENVGMGMGGDWLVEVAIEVPGQPIVIVYFRVPLSGPM
jgi:YtkA-like